MRLYALAVLAMCVACTILDLLAHVTRYWLVDIAGNLSFLVLVFLSLTAIAVVLVRRFDRWAVLAVLFCIAFLSLGPRCVRYTAQHLHISRFRSLHVEYEQLIALIDNAQEYRNKVVGRSALPKQYQHLALVMHSTAFSESGTVDVVELITHGRFPVRHTGFLFVRSGQLDTFYTKRWPVSIPITSRWFYVAD